MNKIWLISYNFDGVMSGPSIRFQRYAPFFMERGYRLQFVVNWDNPLLPQHEEYQYFSVHRIVVRPRFFSRTRFTSQAILMILNKGGFGSCVLSFGYQTYQIWLLPLFRFVFRFRLYYINTMAPSSTFIMSPRYLALVWNTIHRFIYRRLYNTLNGVICSTPELGNKLLHAGLLSKSPIIINNGVDTSRFHPVSEKEKKDVRKNLGLPPVSKLFLFIGLKTERKGIRELCEAWISLLEESSISDSYLLLVGDEKAEANPHEFNLWWDTFKQISRSKNILVFPGSSQVYLWFQAVDIFVFPSKKEGMPNVLLEAMATGLPVIMNQFEGYSLDYGPPNTTHLIFKHDVLNRNLINILNYALFETDKIKSIGLEALNHAQQNFSVDFSIEKYLKIINIREKKYRETLARSK